MDQGQVDIAHEPGAPLWRPRLEPEDAPFEPEAGDSYVVVDDIEAGRAVVVACPWPAVDALGHLAFPDDAASLDLALTDLQAAVDRERARAGQPAPARPLRVGDVFWVRADDVDRDSPDPGAWQILDVTRAARRSAKAALLLAASPALRSPPSVRAVEADAEADEDALEPPPTGTAPPAV